MAYIGGVPTLSELDLYSSTSTAPSGLELGDMVGGPQGKFFRLVYAGGSDLVVGNLLQSPAVDTQFDDMTVPAAVAAATTQGTAITITNGTTTVAAGDFVGGTLEVSVTPALGEEYTIIDHGTATNGASLTLYLDRPIRTAWTTSTKVTLRKNPFRGVIQAPTTLTGSQVGVANYAIPTNKYGFVQVAGVGAVLSDATTGAVGSALSNSATVAGAAGVFVAGTGRSFVGHAMRALASGKTVPVDLEIF